jgi:alpha-ribazole phosphatase
MEVLLVRHPQTLIDAGSERRNVGHTDIDLSPHGETHVQSITTDIVKFNPTLLISSDLRRCKKLALYTSSILNIDLHVNPLWREVNFGLWENKTWSQLEALDADAVKLWMNDYVRVAPPDGESFTELQRRISAELDELTRRADSVENFRVAIITHAGAIRAAICYITGLPLECAFSIDVDYGGSASLRYKNGHWTLFELRTLGVTLPV